jgi:predicted kinase
MPMLRQPSKGSAELATLHLVCGLPGAGKTTFAKQLELSLPALRLTPDDHLKTLYGLDADTAVIAAARDPLEAFLYGLALRVLELGVDVVIDYGFWSRAEREFFARGAHEVGADAKLYFADLPLAELWRRIEARNGALTLGDMPIRRDEFDIWAQIFQRPAPEEGAILIYPAASSSA